MRLWLDVLHLEPHESQPSPNSFLLIMLIEFENDNRDWRITTNAISRVMMRRLKRDTSDMRLGVVLEDLQELKKLKGSSYKTIPSFTLEHVHARGLSLHPRWGCPVSNEKRLKYLEENLGDHPFSNVQEINGDIYPG